LGTKAGELLHDGIYNVMVGVKGEECVAVPLEEVAWQTKTVPLDHPWLKTARLVDTCLGDASILEG
jgi:6-phosphofructokinase 1